MPTKTRRRLGASLIALWAVGLVVPRPATATVHPLDAIIPDDTPMPSRGLVAWVPGAQRAYVRPSGKLGHAGTLKAADVDGTPGFDLSAKGANVEVQHALLGPSDAGMTVAVDYLLPKGVAQPKGWNPMFSFLVQQGGALPEVWAVVLKDGVPRLEVTQGTTIKPATAVKTTDPVTNKPVAVRLDDHQVHQLAIRVIRPGCGAGTCQAPDRNLVTLLVDGVVVSEGIIHTPMLKAQGIARVTVGSKFVGAGKFTTQPNFKDALLMPIGVFRQLLVYDRALATGELLAIKRAASLGVVAQFPPLGNETATEVRYSALVPASDLKMAPHSAAIAGDLLQHKAVDLVPGFAAQTKGLTSVSAWIRVPKPTAETKVLSVTFPGMSSPVDLTVKPATAGTYTWACKHGGKLNDLSPYEGDTPVWHHVTITQRGTYKDAVCVIDGAFLGQLKQDALKVPSFDETKVNKTVVVKHGTFDIAYLAERRRAGSQHLNAEVEFNGRDPLAQGPMAWVADGKVVRHPFTYWGTAMIFFDGHALGNVRLLGNHLWTYSDSDIAWWVDRQTVTLRFGFSITDLLKDGFTKTLFFRNQLDGHKSISATLVVPSQADCGAAGLGPGRCYQLNIDMGPRRFRIGGKGLQVLQLVDGTLTFTTPYKRTPAELAQWGNPESSWQPDIVFNSQRLTPKSWKELESPWAAAAKAGGGDTEAKKKAWKEAYSYGIGADEAVKWWRMYPHVVGELSGLGTTGCWGLDCYGNGRKCAYSGPDLSGYCADCREGHYRAAGQPGHPFQECRPVRPRGAACASDAMCATGKCDTANSGTCVFKDKGPCDSQCNTQGRSCVAQGSGFDCGGCKAWFQPANGAPIAKPGAPAPKLLPSDVCKWAPTKQSLETCTANEECHSGSCTVADVDRVTAVYPKSRTATEKLVGVAGWSGCEKSTANCSRWFVSQPNSTSVATIKDTKKTCAVVITPGMAAADDPCVTLTGKTHDPGTKQNVTRPDGSTATVARCAFGAGGSCVEPGLKVQSGVLSQAACKRAFNRPHGVAVSGSVCKAEKRHPSCGLIKCAWKKCYKDHDTLNKTTWYYTSHSAHTSLKKLNRSSFTATDLVRLFYPFANPDDANAAGLVYNEATHRNALLKNGVSRLLLDYALANYSKKVAMEKAYGPFLPISMCSRQTLSTLKTKDYADTTSVYNYATGKYGADTEDSVYASEANYHKCRPDLQENDALCPPAGYTGTQYTGKDFCLSNYCSRETKTCQEVDHPMYELGANGEGKGKSGKSAVKFGVVRLDDTSVNVEDSHAGDASKAGKTTDYQFDATMSQNYVACILGKPMPSTPLLSAKVFVDRTAGGDNCAESETTVKILGFKLDALIPKTESGGLSNCKGINVEAKQSVIASKSQKVGFTMCIDDDSNQCSFTPENLLSLPLSRYFPKPEVCVPTDELELPEVKKDFKEALVPLIISIGLELDMCLTGSFGLDYETKMPQVEVAPELAIGVVARGGVGSGETGAYEVSAGVRLLLTLVSISFPVTWGIEADAALKSVTGEAITGYFKIALVQRIAMALEFLGGEFGLYAKIAVGPFGLEWTFNIFEWTGIKVEVTLSQNNLIDKIIDFEVPRETPPSKASISCKAGDNPCYQ